ncbi:MAG: Curculin domain protein (Mannose-binding) lectin, partial [Berkelbacteria bacterium GW2011_GWA2_35_9]
MKKFYTQSAIVFGLAVIMALIFSNRSIENVIASSFNQNNLISDGAFIDKDSMSVTEIQNFLSDKGSYLKDYSSGGRSAAQIIWDASHGYGDASGSINGISVTTSTGTVSPKVILVTLQKEQSLISRTTQNDSALNAAMGYACPDSGGCSSTYAGFTKQVENGAWQLRYNYERAQGTGFSDYQVGQSTTFSDWNGNNSVTFDNRATASLYRYTPHVYNGNYNFWNIFTNTYSFESPAYGFRWAGQSGYPTVAPGSTTTLTITYTNIGSNSWNSSTNLGIYRSEDRTWESGWYTWARPATVSPSSVAPGETGTFSFNIAVPANQPAGTYRFYVKPIQENVRWIDEAVAWWDITVPHGYTASWSSQTAYPTIAPGASTSLTIAYNNTGSST